MLRDGCFDGLDLVFVDVDDPLARGVGAAGGGGGRDGDRQVGRVPRWTPDVPLVVAEVNPDDLR